MTHARIAPGCRRLTPAHVQVQAIAERFEGLPDRRLEGTSARRPQAGRPATRPFPAPARRHRRPVRLQRAAGLATRQPADRLALQPQARDHARPGPAAGAERPQCADLRQADHARRQPHRPALGTPRRQDRQDRRGLRLRPLADCLRHAEFVAIAERAAAEERERAALRRRLTIARKAIQQIAETAIEHQLTDRDWRYWLAEALTLVLTIRDDLPLDGLQAVVAELEQRRADGETALRAAFDSQQIASAGAIECTPITTTNQPKADNSATRNIDSEEPRSGPGDSPVSADPVSPERSQPPLPAVTPKFVLTVSPELKPYIFTASPSWADIVEAANGLRQQLGISRSAWIDACQAMGRYQAATAVAVIAAKGKTIRSPGGYLRGMIGRAQNGELHLSNSLWGLARRERSPGTYDA